MKKITFLLSFALLFLLSSCHISNDPTSVADLKKSSKTSFVTNKIDSILLTNNHVKINFDSIRNISDAFHVQKDSVVAKDTVVVKQDSVLLPPTNLPDVTNPDSSNAPATSKTQFVNSDFNGSIDGWQQIGDVKTNFVLNPNGTGIGLTTPGIEAYDYSDPNQYVSLYARSSSVLYQDGFAPGTYTIEIVIDDQQPGNDAADTGTGYPTGTDIIYFDDSHHNPDVTERLLTVMPGKSTLTKTLRYTDPSNIIGFNIYIKMAGTEVGLKVKIDSIRIISYETL